MKEKGVEGPKALQIRDKEDRERKREREREKERERERHTHSERHRHILTQYRFHPLQKQVKLIDRRVRDEFGGLRVRWTSCKMSRFFLIPEGLHVPFSYVRCTCVKCEWPPGRAPLYPSDAIRNYQRRHKDQVVVPIPPPATCQGDRNLLDPILQCGCRRCEESRNCSIDESYARVDKLRMPERHRLSRMLSGSDAPKTVDLLYSSATGDPFHLRFTAPYTHRVYEMLNLPKPAQIWADFGVPAALIKDGNNDLTCTYNISTPYKNQNKSNNFDLRL